MYINRRQYKMGSISRVVQSRVPNVTFDVAHQVFQSAGVTTSEEMFKKLNA